MNYLGHCVSCDYALFAEDSDIETVEDWRSIHKGQAPKRVEPFGIYGRCPEGHKAFKLRSVKGKFSAKHECDSRCMNAKGYECTCSCGGANHGREHAIEIVQIPTAHIESIDMATEAQLRFINTLLDEREISAEKLSVTLSRLEEGLTKDLASKWITKLKELPRKV